MTAFWLVPLTLSAALLVAWANRREERRRTEWPNVTHEPMEGEAC